MKRDVLIIVLCLSLLSACGLSPETIATQTATAATAIAASWTRTSTPTPTPTLTPTSTPTATFTPTPIPTLLGGGNGKLMFFKDLSLYSYDTADQTAKIVLTQEQLMEALKLDDISHIWGSVSPDGKTVWIRACRDNQCKSSKSALVTMDLSNIIDLEDYFRQWSFDGKKLLAVIPPKDNVVRDGYSTYIIDIIGTNLGNKIELEKNWFATISPNGKQVYYTTSSEFKVINSDGTNERTLACDECNEPRAAVIAISPNGQRIALAIQHKFDNLPTTNNSMISTSQSHIVIVNSDFSAPKVFPPNIIRFAEYPEIFWLPDNENIVFRNSEYDLDKQPVGLRGRFEVIQILSTVSGEMRVIRSTEPWIIYDLCGSSPDGKLITYIMSLYSAETQTQKSFIYIQDLQTNTAYRLTSFDEGEESCPDWLSK